MRAGTARAAPTWTANCTAEDAPRARVWEQQVSPDEHTLAEDSPGRHIGGEVSTLVFIDQLCGACYVFPLGLGCPSCGRKQG